MLKIKIFGAILSAILLSLFAVQVKQANAQSANSRKAVTGPLTSPITGPCKPGWGFGDMNHCHSGPPGQNKQNSGQNND